jgi:aminoglycoside phosphotransferase (APT) family kinase protein
VAREIGPLLASGRDGDIFEYGPGLVLRRARDGRNIGDEARVIQYAADHGFPVPAVEEVRGNGTEIVMERIDGPMMMDVMGRQPWTLVRYATMLADLHDTLHAIPGPDWLRRLPGGGDRLLHLDLHPLNVMLSERGPVVIDWTNAHRGDPLFDVATTYVLLTCPEIPASQAMQLVMNPARKLLAGQFARRYRGHRFNTQLALAAERKALDKNMTPTESANCRKLATRARTRPGRLR